MGQQDASLLQVVSGQGNIITSGRLKHPGQTEVSTHDRAIGQAVIIVPPQLPRVMSLVEESERCFLGRTV